MAGKSGFAIGVSVQDGASAGLDAINKRLAAMQAPAERFNKSLAKFGEVSGINRAAEGMASLGDRALGAARAVERLAGPMAGITGAVSLGGIAEMSRRWADAGTQIGKTAYLLNAPVEKLSALRGAARLAGSSAEAMDGSLEGLNKTLIDAQFGRNGATRPFEGLKIGFKQANGEARDLIDVFHDVVDAVGRAKNPADKQHVLESFGMSPDLMPAVKDGWKGFEVFLKRARQTGGVMTGEMVENANKMHSAWERLGMAIEGAADRLENKWAPAVTRALDAGEKWLEAHPDQADAAAETGAAASGYGAAKSVAKLLRWLGWGPLGGLIGVGADLAMPLALSGDTGPNSGGVSPEQEAINRRRAIESGALTPGQWWERHKPSWWGGGAAAGAPGITVPRMPSAAAGVMWQAHDFFRGKGLSEAQTAGILTHIAAESGFDPDKIGDGGSSFGLFQEHAERRAALLAKYGPHPSVQQQLDNAWGEYTAAERPTLDRILRTTTARDAAIANAGFERFQGWDQPGNAELARRADAAGQFEGFAAHPGGAVTVDVNLRGAPSGTTATVTSSGAVAARPPRVETSMPMAH